MQVRKGMSAHLQHKDSEHGDVRDGDAAQQRRPEQQREVVQRAREAAAGGALRAARRQRRHLRTVPGSTSPF